MAQPFFGRRDPEPTPLRNGSPVHPSGATAAPAGAPVPASLQAAPGSPAAGVSSPASTGAPTSGGSKLTVGPNIKLKGLEITDCDTLVVEGMVEATMNSRVIQIAEQGAFTGAAEIDIAEIHGRFDGNLTARKQLVIHATGRVVGTIRYGKIVVEEGGQISGDVAVISDASLGASAAKPGMSPLSAPGIRSGLQVA